MADNFGKTLSEEFDVQEIKEEVKEMRQRIDQAKNITENPDEILYGNIQRANDLLDKIEENLYSSFSARLVEVAAQLVNAITSAANSIVSNEVAQETTEQKREYLDLKKLDYELKKSKAEEKTKDQKSLSYNQQNIIVSNREDILDLIKNQKNVNNENTEKLSQ